MTDLQRYYLFANVVADDASGNHFGLVKRHVSNDHKTSICHRVTVTDTAWIGPLLCEELISCSYCVTAWKRLKELEKAHRLQPSLFGHGAA